MPIATGPEKPISHHVGGGTHSLEGSRAYLPLRGRSVMYFVHPSGSRGMQLARGSCYQAQHIQRILWLLSPTQWLFLVLTTWLAGTRGTGGAAGKASQHQGFSQVGSQH